MTPTDPGPTCTLLGARRARARVAWRALLVAGTAVVLLGACTGDDSAGGTGPEVGAEHPDDDQGAPAEAITARGATTGPQGRVPQFEVECELSHSAPDDPIVHPGQPGRAHRHDFFGSTDTDAHSTPASLVGTGTTCQNRNDTAAYWVPALLHHGEPVAPALGVAYYRPGPGVDPATVEPYPAGLVVIAGDQTATEPQAVDVAAWHCGASPILHSDPPTCPRTATLGVRIAFPDCWDGEDLDSHDHQSHLAYSATGMCPSSHPVPVPQLIFEVRYPFAGDPAGLELASGGVRSLHADFVQAWDQAALEREVRACLNRGKVCGVVSNRATG
ncbi:MAG: DUF1996 domain-containing protein [Acidimicrobiia bacterium]